MHLLIVEDDPELGEFLSQAFERDEHRITRASSCEEATHCLQDSDLGAVLLGSDAGDEHLSWCRSVRADGYMLPVIVLSARSTVSRRVEALDAGADDFLARPFAIAELRARIRALGRRLPVMRVPELTSGDVRIQITTRRVWVKQEEVTLTAREWSVVELIVHRRGHLVPRTEILDKIWGEISDANHASLDVIIGRVRKKLGVGFIVTLRGEGFVLR